VGHAHDGEEACLLYKQLCPDILILDLRIQRRMALRL
jgi:chemotaxis response regulator CheB